MKRLSICIVLGLVLCSSLAGSSLAFRPDVRSAGTIVVANRGSGTLSLIDVRTDQVIDTIPLPAGNLPPEPMYVVHVPSFQHHAHRVFVGDRANQRIVVWDVRDNFRLLGTIPAGRGVFHMWAHSWRPHLWVNNDIDNTATVIHTTTLQVITTVRMPADLVALGGKPHDVILDYEAAYITMIGFAGSNDYVIKFNRYTFEEVARAAVGKDPHVTLTTSNALLYVAAQGSNVVQVLHRDDLTEATAIPIPGAHGVCIPPLSRTLYVTNLPGGGTDGLFTIDLIRHVVVGEAVDTAFPTPHNLVATADGRKLYMTHSGATAQHVSVYSIARKAPVPVPLTTLGVELNPFGLAFVPPAYR